MRLTTEKILLVVVTFVLIIFIFRDCSRPSEEADEEKKKAYEQAITDWKAMAEKAAAQSESILNDAIKRKAKDSVFLKAKDERIAALVKQAARQRTPRVDTLIIENPDLKSFVDTQTEIIQEQKQEIDTLKSALQFHLRVNQDLIALENIEDKIEAQMAIENSIRIADLEKALKKRERKSKLKGILVPVALISGLLLGSQL